MTWQNYFWICFTMFISDILPIFGLCWVSMSWLFSINKGSLKRICCLCQNIKDLLLSHTVSSHWVSNNCQFKNWNCIHFSAALINIIIIYGLVIGTVSISYIIIYTQQPTHSSYEFHCYGLSVTVTIVTGTIYI